MGAIHQALIASSGGGGGTDPHFANVVLLCHFDGTDGSTTIVDSSSSAKTPTVVDDCELDTAQAKFGPSSLLLLGQGVGGSSVRYADSSDWNFGSGNFTVEGFVRFNDKDSDSGNQCFISQYQSTGNQRAWYIRLTGGNTIQAFFSTNGSTDGLGGNLSASWTPSNNVWYYIVFERSGDTFRLVVDATVMDSHTASLTQFDSSEILRIGALGSASVSDQFVDGWLDEWRVTKGVARYNGTYTVPTAAFPDS